MTLLFLHRPLRYVFFGGVQRVCTSLPPVPGWSRLLPTRTLHWQAPANLVSEPADALSRWGYACPSLAPDHLNLQAHVTHVSA